ncbi:MAG: URC4/urg3 family protein [Cellvibrionaceae bacterium]|nr:URC4/urg3 family protein [Cellvibrionaceae bacterium]
MTAEPLSQTATAPNSVDFFLSPAAVRQRCTRIYERACEGHGHFAVHPEKLDQVAAFVIAVIEQNYPDKNVPYHSRWRHFEVGDHSQLQQFNQHCADLDPHSRAQLGLELILPSVLVDAGAGGQWQYASGNRLTVGRSEGLALASLDMFLSGGLSQRATPECSADGLRAISEARFAQYFKVSPSNPLLGVAGRVHLLRQLGEVIAAQPEIFPRQRLGDLLDFIIQQCGPKPNADQLLTVILKVFADIWPGRLSLQGKNLGDTWHYAPLGEAEQGYVPFHKLSQWITYSVVETLEKNAFPVSELEQLTGLAEYRNGGLMLDSGLISLRDPALAQHTWPPSSEVIIEWRALTVCLLDKVAACIRDQWQLSANDLPLVKVLEGGTWAAGRKLAQQQRGDLSPPLNIASDGTVF